MALSEHQLDNIVTRTRECISLMTTVNKRNFERRQFEDFVTHFTSLDSAEIKSFITDIYNEQFNSLEQACIENYDYILITGLGNLKTNQARQEILEVIKQGGTTNKNDIQPIIDKYIKSKEAIHKIVQVDIKLNFNEKDTLTR
jgi:hypothetical protein